MAEALHQELTLYITSHYLYIVPKESKQLMVIVRQNGTIILHQQDLPQRLIKGCKIHKIYGILGIISLVSGPHLVVVKNRAYVGRLENQDVYQLTRADVISLPTSTIVRDRNENRICLSMVEQVLATPFYYFSYTYDLTHTMQRCAGILPSTSLFERADTRFVWNYALLTGWYRPELQQYCLPLVHGFISFNEDTINGHQLQWALIARRSRERAGTRLFRRGINHWGHVANFVETEQIIVCGTQRMSFVQTRGSIPLFWKQIPNLRYSPVPQLVPYCDHLMACEKHLDDQRNRYGRITIINLIAHHGTEAVLKNAYEATVKRLAKLNVHYEGFDFNRECHRLSVLLNQTANGQSEMGEFHCTVGNQCTRLHSVQRGVFRTNCIDCLDRTNVVQSVLAQRSLQQSLTKLLVIRGDIEFFDGNTKFESNFRRVWADHANVLSQQYAGTRALKSDITRNGKRTAVGLLNDTVSSMTRYFRNNFTDGFRQDAIDLFLCTLRESPGKRFAFPVKHRSKSMIILSTLLLSLALAFLLLIMRQEQSQSTMLFLKVCPFAVVLTMYYVSENRDKLIDWPRLQHHDL